MARVTHVKSAKAQFHTKPVLNEDGTPKVTPVMVKDRKTGELVQKVTKRGKPVVMAVTVRDLDRPKPLEVCGHCKQPIEVGTPYKHISPRSGPYGGRKLSRHESCPNWNVWEYSSSLSARIAQIQNEWTDLEEADGPDDFTDALSAIAEQIRELAEEKRESASNIEDGFGHETEQSAELNDIADQLDSWADDVESPDLPELPEVEQTEKWFVTGPDAQSLDENGYEDEDEANRALETFLQENPDEDEDDWNVTSEEAEDEEGELSEEQMNEWLEEANDAARSVVEEAPL